MFFAASQTFGNLAAQPDRDFEFEIVNNSPLLRYDDKRKRLLLLKTTKETESDCRLFHRWIREINRTDLGHRTFGMSAFAATDLFELRLGVDVHITDLAMKRFVLEARRRLRRPGQL